MFNQEKINPLKNQLDVIDVLLANANRGHQVIAEAHLKATDVSEKSYMYELRERQLREVKALEDRKTALQLAIAKIPTAPPLLQVMRRNTPPKVSKTIVRIGD